MKLAIHKTHIGNGILLYSEQIKYEQNVKKAKEILFESQKELQDYLHQELNIPANEKIKCVHLIGSFHTVVVNGKCTNYHFSTSVKPSLVIE